MWGGAWDIHRLREVDSTNTYVRDRARHGDPAGLVAVADHQTAGRGRLDRRWESPPGANLLASVLILTVVPPSVKLSQAAVEHCCFLISQKLNDVRTPATLHQIVNLLIICRLFREVF